MKIAYLIILSVLACSLLFFILIMKPKEKRVSRIVFECFLWAWLVMIASIACVFAINYNVCYVFHTIYFIFMDCLIFSFMIFCVRYAIPKVPKWIYSFGVLIIVDIIHFAINLYTRHAFSLITVHLYNDVLLKLDQTPYFAPHLALCFVMLAVGFFFLIKQIIKAPGFYKIRYIYILSSFVIGIVANTLYLMLPIGLDWSVGVYSVICFFSYYFINHHVPIRLQHVTLNHLAEKMDQGLVFYDVDGSCVYISRYFKEYFDIKDCESEEFNNLITKFNDIDENTPKVFEKILDDKTLYYEVKRYNINSKKNEYLGHVFVMHDITIKKQMFEKERYDATHDKLTGIYNREEFIRRSEELLNDNPNTEYLLVMSDIANFKFLNDMFGTEMADQILIAQANLLKEKSKGDDVFGRLYGDRFAIMVPKASFNEGMCLHATGALSETLDKRVANLYTCYIGVCDVNREYSIRHLCDMAQIAIDNIKGTSKRIGYYDTKLIEETLFEQRINGELNDAIKNRDLKMYVQPQYTSSGEVKGGEALVRWAHPTLGLIPPYKFIPLFEKNGKIVEIDKLIWRIACERLAYYKSIGRTDLYISVNISTVDIKMLNIVNEFKGLIEEYDINPKNLKLEITETAVLNEITQTNKLIGELHNLGFILEMDDFGSGYSSLNMLKDIDVDIMKLDMAFLRDSDTNPKCYPIIKTIVSMAKELKLGIVVEGVEKKSHVEYLTSLGVDVFQGYYFAKPMPLEEYEKLVI